MNWEYITGFFDADGSLTLASPSKKENPTPYISFHNNEITILNNIKDFIYKELKIKGFISKKLPKNDNHHIAYDLKYSNLPKCLLLLNKMSIIHPKKLHRKKIIFELAKLNKRNGKYTKEELETRNSLVVKFFSHS